MLMWRVVTQEDVADLVDATNHGATMMVPREKMRRIARQLSFEFGEEAVEEHGDAMVRMVTSEFAGFKASPGGQADVDIGDLGPSTAEHPSPSPLPAARFGTADRAAWRPGLV